MICAMEWDEDVLAAGDGVVLREEGVELSAVTKQASEIKWER